MSENTMLLKCGNCNKMGLAIEEVPYVYYRCQSCKSKNEVTNVPLKQWLGFNYAVYLAMIKEAIDEDNFELLLAATSQELAAGKMSSTQIDLLKTNLKEAFDNGESIKQIAERIEKDVGVSDLLRMKDGKVFKDESGNPVVSRKAKTRAVAIARTETTRMASEGSIKHYKEAGLTQYRWVASLGPRTCQICRSLHGEIFDINTPSITNAGLSSTRNPAHSNCRCTTVAIVPL